MKKMKERAKKGTISVRKRTMEFCKHPKYLTEPGTECQKKNEHKEK